MNEIYCKNTEYMAVREISEDAKTEMLKPNKYNGLNIWEVF